MVNVGKYTSPMDGMGLIEFNIPGDSIRDLFGMVIRDPFKGLSDLQLGD